jgi:polyisoprenoid-binding protein YceI
MKSILSIALVFIFSSFGMKSDKTLWNFDTAHTTVDFTVTHMVISEVTGKFKDFSGKVYASDETFKDAEIEFVIDAASIFTNNEKRDAHLKNEDFFEVEKYPEIRFKSTDLKHIRGKDYKLLGNLTMHGVTKNITLDAKLNGVIDDPYGNRRASFKITGSLNRLDYKIGEGPAAATVGETVDIVCNVQLIKS